LQQYINSESVRKLDGSVVELQRMLGTTIKFKTLFRKYRLKAEFATLSELELAFAEKGFIYEDSIFSHWQSGTRIPQNRIVLLKLLEIFIDKKAITLLNENPLAILPSIRYFAE
jgi:hypothetical protein